MRAREPNATGFVERDGVRSYYEVHGNGPAILLLPTWAIAHSRIWKMQVAYLARHFRAITFDPRGNGRSDRPRDPAAYAAAEYAADALAVLDATGTERAVLVALSRGTEPALRLAGGHPARVAGLVAIGASLPPLRTEPEEEWDTFDRHYSSYEGWRKWNRHYWREHYADFAEFFFAQAYNEPHSTKQREDAVGWALETDAETLVATHLGAYVEDLAAVHELVAGLRCPVLVIHGGRDEVVPPAVGATFAALTGGTLVTLAGSGHCPHARDPVKVNLLIREFAAPPPRPATWTRARSRPRRALFVSSPIGLGHARRDLAIARELRRLRPGLEIDWLAQHPVTALLEAAGERIHPASAALASESAHMESEAGEHDLPCFAAWRRMDEILLANFMVFHDLVEAEPYDLWIGDEAWEVDHYLHENPELKRAAYVWLTDFVGWLPMEPGEAGLTADHNAEMIEQVERHPRVRDRALFVGQPEDIVPGTFGDGLPEIREWVERHYAFTGYIADPPAVRAPSAGPVCLVTAGGSAVGAHLLRRVVEALPLVPGLRMIVLAGPRIDPAGWPAAEGLEVRGFEPELPACDVAVIQGGLSTAMELTAARRPFLYFPLRRHFEQNVHVPHRLDRYGAGRRMDYARDGPEEIAAGIAQALARPFAGASVETGGAARAAAAIAELL
jgi:pimeloyl-ACP methyl ester carboxylesterase/predicted glycosyltransferase